MPRRQVERAAEETISEEMIANIPVVAQEQATTTFATLEEEVIVMTETTPDADATATPEQPAEGPELTIAQQLRYEMGEAFARELDRAELAVSEALSKLAARLAAAEEALVRAHEAADRERQAREEAERRLRAFKELALK